MKIDAINELVVTYLDNAQVINDEFMDHFSDMHDKKTALLLLAYQAIEHDNTDKLECAVSHLVNIMALPVLQPIEICYPKYLRAITKTSSSLVCHILQKNTGFVMEMAVCRSIRDLNLSIKTNCSKEVSKLLAVLPALWDYLSINHKHLILKNYHCLYGSLSESQAKEVGRWFHELTRSDSFSLHNDYCEESDELTGFASLSPDLPQSELELTMLQLLACSRQDDNLDVYLTEEQRCDSIENFFRKSVFETISFNEVYQSMTDPDTVKHLGNKMINYTSLDDASELNRFFKKNNNKNDINWRVLAACYDEIVRSDSYTNALTEEEFVSILLKTEAVHNHLNVA
ncbi:MAG: hypothetical protein CMF46_04335 [Legionellales bacterium]|nr:hypothetical protein [Legionellales bacterium]